MKIRHVNTWLLGSLAGAMMLLGAGSAQAMGFKLGEADVNVDTTLSLGVGIRTSKQDCTHVSQYNGGCPAGNGTYFGVNDDDGNVNTDQWDPYSIVAKVTSDIEVKYQNYGAFARVKAFYDYWADKQLGQHDNQYGRRPTEDFLRGSTAHDSASRDVSLLDAFVYGNFNVGEQQLTLRAGKQVINWGESLLIPGGISSYLPVDLGALRTPGAELKEAYQPVPAIYTSLSLPYNLSVEAFWQWQWKKTQVDSCGTFFATTDSGCEGGMYVMSGGEYPYPDTIDSSNPPDPSLGTAKALRVASSEAGANNGNYGAALKYYADWLNDGTDLGLYYVHYSTALPIGTFTSVNLLTNLANKKLVLQYPDRIQTLGASFNTTVPLLGGSAFSGEVAYSHDMPFAITDIEENCNDISVTLGSGFAGHCRANATQVSAGQTIRGYDRFNVAVGQLSMISTLPTSNSMTELIHSDLIVLIANAGFQYIPGLDSANNRLTIPRASNMATDALVQALLNPAPGGASSCNTPGRCSPQYATPFSWGYRLIASADYNNAFGTSVTLTPNIQFAHDVDGYSAGPIGPGFIQNKKVVTLGLNAKYQDWRAALAWTYNWGNTFRNFSSDKDFATATISYAF